LQAADARDYFLAVRAYYAAVGVLTIYDIGREGRGGASKRERREETGTEKQGEGIPPPQVKVSRIKSGQRRE